MSRKARKLLDRMRETKAGWHAHDFHTLYLGFGFIRRGTNHAVYTHEVFEDLIETVPTHPGELPPIYASKAVKLIDELLRRTGGDGDRE